MFSHRSRSVSVEILGRDKNHYKNLSMKASTSSNHLVSCNYCGNKGHISSSYFIKKNNFKRRKYIWIEKGTKKPYSIKTNLEGPKMIWIPKKS